MSTNAFTTALKFVEPAGRFGFVRKVAPGRVEADGPMAAVGDICEIRNASAEHLDSVLAEVAAVEEERIILIPFDQTVSILPDARVQAHSSRAFAPVGEGFAGRAVDAMAEPIDNAQPIAADATRSLAGIVMAPMDRLEPDTILETGVRALDGLLTIGRGQRIGVFSASGVGKTTLMRQIAAQAACDRCVVCLVGERGKEVEALWRDFSAHGDRDRYTCVAATSDLSAPLRARAVNQALALAEYWRDQGQHVLLMLDSVTRFAMALREIGLAAGSPPTLRAYTPNVFAALPRLVERCGAAKSGGSITAVMTVLSETDDVDDPIVEVMKALLDGHIVLSRQLAEQGRFPAIDVTRSVSRQSERLMTPHHAEAARRVIGSIAAYEEARIMIESGIYRAGANTRIDDAVKRRDGFIDFLRQRSDEHTSLPDTLRWLEKSIAGAGLHA